jgi:hypothetical protein
VGFVVDEVALGQVFSEYFGFPLPIDNPSTAPYSVIIIASAIYLDSERVVK